MRKRTLIELTPLLDVILLLLFASLIFLTSQSDDQVEKYDELEQEYNQTKQELVESENVNDSLLDENEILKNRIISIKSDLAEQNISMSNLSEANEKEKENLEKALHAFNDITKINKSELEKLFNDMTAPSRTLNNMVDSEDIVLEMYKYSYVMNRFYFIDIELTGEENRIHINGEKTNLAVSEDDNENSDTRKEKSLLILDKLQEHIAKRSGGDEIDRKSVV